ncbi:DNA-O6-methylguanine--protein-cysteine S-methyltransferase /Transcriptional regulator Ada /transcriptional regulator, AraC family [Marinobacter daqiaonensis]|uniref:methylated-DNA--[protein]-cysteine S-methyltransferase n=1 Tax=Marinobacter daqiaonensis TaxID=650891 RepID=A0A1I6GYL8_9GAMM|nr:methylated-DNA--[protein]-cysteine S-methyltransferase [Marinobacter daqiaonensis]SFR47283.1 DNA-O6-methylguanine--protein-cysteine S-methyltransferase /Transcriptional regulator Ada /transcriptional regulator, AraC family [Marinobacter daqiaonensis]
MDQSDDLRLQQMSDYRRIEKAMVFMAGSASRQPTLDEISAHVHLSPFHFQRVFCRWSGTTPKRFLQAITLERGKRLLREDKALLEVSHDVGLSGSSRLHDHFVQLEAVTPGEFRNGGEGLCIEYGFHQTPLGQMFVAITPRGICRMGFIDHTNAGAALKELRRAWPKSTLISSEMATRHVIDVLFRDRPGRPTGPLSLHVTGTNFQVAVWRALLRIPPGRLASYSLIAAALGRPGSSRAVGNAVGANPVALLIPCHRVIQQSGALGGYRWGTAKKQMVQTWEQLRSEFL